VFTRVLIKEMRTPGQSFDQVIHDVRNQVVQLASSVGHTQTPGYYSQFTGDFFFIPPSADQAGAAVTPSAADPRQFELAYWESIKDSRDAVDYQDYLKPQHAAHKAAATAATPTPVVSQVPAAASPVPAVSRKQRGERCDAILENAQLGESLSDDDRTYIREKCQ